MFEIEKEVFCGGAHVCAQNVSFLGEIFYEMTYKIKDRKKAHGILSVLTIKTDMNPVYYKLSFLVSGLQKKPHIIFYVKIKTYGKRTK